MGCGSRCGYRCASEPKTIGLRMEADFMPSRFAGEMSGARITRRCHSHVRIRVILPSRASEAVDKAVIGGRASGHSPYNVPLE
ncbi:hypothetical protein KCP76_10675 [Salmonella enterica subsp. enterica serovar Weltevreden]|nr:hypothetical protein KCP76_10675 [Salmonella enterica subsp. enterica serovar Weltevreden]